MNEAKKYWYDYVGIILVLIGLILNKKELIWIRVLYVLILQKCLFVLSSFLENNITLKK